MEQTVPRLRFRTYHVTDEDQYPAAWGCRFIWHMQRGIDFVPDRQDCIGDNKADRDALVDWLNANLNNEQVEKLLRQKAPRLTTRDDTAVTLVDDDQVRVVVSPQASHGYLYCTAVWKKAAE